MKRIPFLLFFIILVSCISQSEKAEIIEDQNITKSSSDIPLFTPTSTQFNKTDINSHNSIIYGIKSRKYNITTEKGLPLYRYFFEQTNLYNYDLELHQEKLVFSDSNLPVNILHHQGSVDTDISDIVYPSNISHYIFALMLERYKYIKVDNPGSMYIITIDGKNNYTRLYDINIFANYYISPDEKMIAYYDYETYSIIIRNSRMGIEINRIDLSEYKYLGIPSLSWSPDSKSILIGLLGGSGSPKSDWEKEGCYLVNILENKIRKINSKYFQSSAKLDEDYDIIQYSYKYFPKTNKLLGIAVKYVNNSYYTKLFSIELNGSNIIEIPIQYNEHVSRYIISPDEKFIAYECKDKICIENIVSHQVEIIGQTIITKEEGIVRGQTLVGWMNE
jgi:hypothetical protein